MCEKEDGEWDFTEAFFVWDISVGVFYAEEDGEGRKNWSEGLLVFLFTGVLFWYEEWESRGFSVGVLSRFFLCS